MNTEYASAAAIHEAGERGSPAGGFQPERQGAEGVRAARSDRRDPLAMPARMVMSGAAIGHIPNKKDKHTRPVYILGECRQLLKN